ncbi:MAG TPA: NADH:flavin oxidoreductase [Acidimicrobiales bacterium]|nr:NADH:flavin oxidoreductase [Acidimicrobiales bacterium]
MDAMTMSPTPTDPFSPAGLGPLQLRNRFIKSATFEGLTRDNVASDRLVEFHRQIAAGGVAMTTVAYCAVSPEGSTDGKTLLLREEAVPGLARLAEAVHAEGALASAQIGHAGAVANAAATGLPSIGPTRILNPLGMRRTLAASEAEIQRITEAFADGARHVADAGFDAVEVHLGHGYLLSSFLSPKLNTRTDRWGGSLENRARFPRQVLEAVREAVGGRMAVTAKLNMADGVPGGFWLDESVEVARWLEQDGTVDALELTGGSSLENPMYYFRGEAPVAEMAEIMPRPIRRAFKLVGGHFLHSYPFEEGYFLPYARQFRAALDLPLILLGGVGSMTTVRQAMDDGFEFVAMGRALLREPDLVHQWQAGEHRDSLCIHCNKCMPTIYRGTHCVLVPREEQLGR